MATFNPGKMEIIYIFILMILETRRIQRDRLGVEWWPESSPVTKSFKRPFCLLWRRRLLRRLLVAGDRLVVVRGRLAGNLLSRTELGRRLAVVPVFGRKREQGERERF
ncbi:hypothetical protein PanWU01x14_176810 [Parasponia andersonii]|uniref:Uncharacterized protein n=1 Tax=Parasponia andersonii TaxID=3476 RepID=A0A2P5C7W0_PARAD|nr:hypothetical protein PanWU01x14_176810 [Parasponia andersonii]